MACLGLDHTRSRYRPPSLGVLRVTLHAAGRRRIIAAGTNSPFRVMQTSVAAATMGAGLA
jgi:hypothetical protein